MIEGKRFRIRLLRGEADCRAMVAAYNDVSQRAQTDHTEIKPLNRVLSDFARTGLWHTEGGTCLITDKNDQLLGTIDFTSISEYELALGYRLFRAADRAQGIMGEVLPLFAAYLFATKPIRRLRIQTAEDNIGSQKVAEHAGFTREGSIRQGYFYRGTFCDFIIYGLLREECLPLADLLARQA